MWYLNLHYRLLVRVMSAPCFGTGGAGVIAGAEKVTYNNVVALAPMVRCGTLPFRLLCVKYGADLVWSEELIALKLGKCIRRVDDATGRIGFYNPPRTTIGGSDSDRIPVYLISPYEKGKNIVQIGAATGPTAVEAGMVVVDDVVGIDVNMGCPKPFSTQGAMGSALLSDPDRAVDIVKSLSRNFGSSVGVTCKIRLLPSIPATLEFAKAMISAGANAITVHARTKLENPKDFAHWDVFSLLREELPSHIPIIANGDVFSVADYEHLRTASGVNSVMIGRGALSNPSIFRACKGGVLESSSNLIAEYIDLADSLEHGFANTKYTVQTMVKEAGFVSEDEMFATRNFSDLHVWCDSWKMRMAAATAIHTNTRLRSAFARGVAAPFVERKPTREAKAGMKRSAADAEVASLQFCDAKRPRDESISTDNN